jgi:signal transduction histidine kinase
MYRRLVILSLIIVFALCGLSWLGYRAISMWIQGIEGTRISEFSNAAEEIRLDVKNKLDAFMGQEQNRPYTDYQYYTISEDSSLIPQRQESIETAQEYRYNQERTRRTSSFDNQQVGQDISYQQQIPVTRSPLADNMEHGLAYFNFQIDQDSNTITSPNGRFEQPQDVMTEADMEFNRKVGTNTLYVRDNLLPVLNGGEKDLYSDNLDDKKAEQSGLKLKEDASKITLKYETEEAKKPQSLGKQLNQSKSNINSKGADSGNASNRTGNFNIESFQNTDAETQIKKQSRNVIMSNSAQNEWADAVQQSEGINQNTQTVLPQSQTANTTIAPSQQRATEPVLREQQQLVAADEEQLGSQAIRGGMSTQQPVAGGRGGRGRSGGFGGGQIAIPQNNEMQTQAGTRSDSASAMLDIATDSPINAPVQNQASQPAAQRELNEPAAAVSNQSDIIEVRIEPFVPVVVPAKNGNDSIFGGQVFMVRKVKYEGKELIQGFQLNEKKLLEEVEESTKRLIRSGMSYELGRKQNENSAYTAILDFGFGHILLNLFDNDPGRYIIQISHLRTWYFSIISVVFLAVTLAMISLWLNARAQIKLAQKKDDFVSAVSHELRTPLTSIRMHAEMLEKNWIKSENKLGEYYQSMRTESERLSRLIENVLDFSRIQKGRKKYVFKLGDINKCVSNVIEMMKAYAAQKGFQIELQPGQCREIAFDSDAVTQIVVNLLDNAIKYSSSASDKKIIVRTKSDDQFVLIEVEDRGPGIPHGQRKKVFQEFYRIGAEDTRETTGSGLGLALVKKFAQAHNGFVEVMNAKPTGAIFRVSLAAKLTY